MGQTNLHTKQVFTAYINHTIGQGRNVMGYEDAESISKIGLSKSRSGKWQSVNDLS